MVVVAIVGVSVASVVVASSEVASVVVASSEVASVVVASSVVFPDVLVGVSEALAGADNKLYIHVIYSYFLKL